MSTTLVVDDSKPVNGIYLIKTRQCKMCLLWKPLSNFSNDNKVKCKKTSRCKECKRTVNKKYYDNYRKKKEKEKEVEPEVKPVETPINEPNPN